MCIPFSELYTLIIYIFTEQEKDKSLFSCLSLENCRLPFLRPRWLPTNTIVRGRHKHQATSCCHKCLGSSGDSHRFVFQDPIREVGHQMGFSSPYSFETSSTAISPVISLESKESRNCTSFRLSTRLLMICSYNGASRPSI